MHKGIDVSRWQGEIDFNKVKAAGYDFVIIKAGGSDQGFYTDSCWEKNYKAAKAAGLQVGAYYFVGFLFYGSIAGYADAGRFLEQLQGKQLELPVFVDIETTQPARRKEATDAAIAFCERMEEAGYFVGIYASDISGFKERLEHDRLTAYAHWVADYSGGTDCCKDWQIRQISNRGVVPGIIPYVDLDITAVDYLSIMKKNGLNGFKKGEKNNDTERYTGTRKSRIYSAADRSTESDPAGSSSGSSGSSGTGSTGTGKRKRISRPDPGSY